MSNSLPHIGQVTTARIDGLEIRYAHSGKSDRIPVLLTSPWPESIYAFRGVLPEIETLNPLILLDLPGFGRSESRPDVMSPEGMGVFIVKDGAALRHKSHARDRSGCRNTRAALRRRAQSGPIREPGGGQRRDEP